MLNKMHKLKRRKVAGATAQRAARESGALIPHANSDDDMPSEVSTLIMC